MIRFIFGLCLMLASVTATRSEPLLFHASSSGQPTLDEGEGGGNPFASALIEILGRPEMQLGDFSADLHRLTLEKSRGRQSSDAPKGVFPQDWKLVPRQAGEKRVALVLVVSDYRQSRASSLPGAAHDAHRIADALTKAGFVTETALNLDLSNMRRKLAEFAAASTDFDAAAIYTTGHGLETNGEVYLIPGDYPRNEGNAALRAKALPLAVIANAARAKHVNLVLYGGCRDDPFSN
ncbi:MAG: caspase family protein [Rhodomicrobium sp.]